MPNNKSIIQLNRGTTFLFFLLAGCLLAFQEIHGQTTTAVNQSLGAFNQYRSQWEQEKIYVHTDKNSYITGEICWYRLYCVDASYNKLSSISRIGYVEILDKNNRPVLQEKVSLKPGEADGSLFIPINIQTGTYKFRAYTNWMKNFGPECFFEKAIRIINPSNLQPDSSIANNKRYDIQFLPEGGNLVQNIQSKIAFRITDAYGRGLDCEGFLLNSSGDTLLHFHPRRFGLGNFLFTPTAGQSYKALIRFPQGEDVTRDLPAVYAQGYVMSLSKRSDGRLSVIVHVSPGQDEGAIYLFTHGSHSALPVKTAELVNHVAEFLIIPSELEDGISQITVFSKMGQPVCERVYFKYPEKKTLISATTNPEYGLRQKIDVDLSVTDELGIPAIADLSMAVYRLDSLQGVDDVNIDSYLYLSSELGSFESPDYYFQGNGADREEDMENLLLTHGWRRFNWKNIIPLKPIKLEFSPEHNGHIIQGLLVNSKTGIPTPRIDAYISVPSSRSQFRQTTSDSLGRVKFEAYDFYGSQELIVQTNPKEDSMYHIDITNPFFPKYSVSVPPDFPIPSKNSPTLLDQHIHSQVQRIYDGTRLSQFEMQYVDTNPFYIVPDEKYLLDDYVRFQTMEEVLREYVHSLNVVRRRDNYQLYLFNRPQNEVFTDEPLILIDGVPFFYTNELLHQDPLKIKRLDLINRQYALGYHTYEGIINLTTFHGDLDGIILNPRALVLDYPGIPERREFFERQYTTEEQISSRMPDYRTLLNWSPEIELDANQKRRISFYTSDLSGKYALVVQGLSQTGVPGNKVVFFTVKKL
jgi:hypothetical protein